jgi:general secretion pathway protein C
VRLGYALVTPAGPLGRWTAPAAAPAVAPDTLARFDPFFRSRGDEGGMQVSDLDLKLMGTRLDQATGRGSAIIALEADRQESFAVGDEVVPGVRLLAVAFDSVTLDNAGAREQLFLDQSGPIPAAAPASAPASGQAGAPAAGPRVAAARLGADISMVPRLEGGRITGLVLSPRGSGTGFAAAGLQAGDVLLRVDGQDVSGINDPATLIRRLDAGGVALEVERGGQVTRLRLAARGVAG